MRAGLLVSLTFLIAYHNMALAQDVAVSAKAPPDETISQSYMTLDQECRSLVNKRDSANAIIACKKLADEADKYDPKTHFVTRRGAYVFYTTSLIEAKKYSD